jgi:hypothetical protein
VYEHVFVSLTPRQQGDLGEASAIEWLGYQGASVAVPFGHSPNWDLMAELDGRAIRVQVKTSGCREGDRWAIQLATRGGNQSWSGVSKLLEPSGFDYLFVLVADGRRWFMPSSALGGRSGIRLGGPKYSEYEVERGRPFADNRCRRTPLQSPN